MTDRQTHADIAVELRTYNDIIHSIAHNVRTPLSIIMTTAYILKRMLDSEMTPKVFDKFSERLERINTQVKHINIRIDRWHDATEIFQNAYQNSADERVTEAFIHNWDAFIAQQETLLKRTRLRYDVVSTTLDLINRIAQDEIDIASRNRIVVKLDVIERQIRNYAQGIDAWSNSLRQTYAEKYNLGTHTS